MAPHKGSRLIGKEQKPNVDKPDAYQFLKRSSEIVRLPLGEFQCRHRTHGCRVRGNWGWE
jgi:hypothetical protein